MVEDMQRALYPGSFDPITNGHLDVIERASHLFDEVLVAVAYNAEKKSGLFDIPERIEMIEKATAHNDRIRVVHFQGLLVDYAREVGAIALVRGLRAISDFEYEFQMALMNRKLEPKLETVFLMPREEYTYVSSRLVKEVARLGGDIASLVPEGVAFDLQEKFKESK